MKETKLEKAAREHETNELHRFCRDVEKLTVVGWDVQKAYRFVKEKYKVISRENYKK